MALTQTVIDRLVKAARSDFDRVVTLYDRLVQSGATVKLNGSYGPLLQPDKRDAAQFILFEAAAQFESFCCEAFKIEVRSRFDVQPRRAAYIMGTIDRGLTGIMGWASPKQLQSRGRALFGKQGYFGRLETHLGNSTYQCLSQAHKVKNRVAHTGGKASTEFNNILGQLGVPAGGRRGASVGRVLADYPTNAGSGDRNFHRFIGAYRATVDRFHAEVHA